MQNSAPLPMLIGSFVSGLVLSLSVAHSQPQSDQTATAPVIDAAFNTHVAQPAYESEHPKVLFDAGHNNADTSAGRYKPFADLITSDGYRVVSNARALTPDGLKAYPILVIVNASGPPTQRDAPAFTDNECAAVRDWVSSGGSLLLVTDSAPFSAAIGTLSKGFGVEISRGYTIETVHYNKESDDQTELVFTRENHLIGDHPVTQGRTQSERVSRIISFSGTSLKGPTGSVAFLKLSDAAQDVMPPDKKSSKPEEQSADHKTVSAAGRAQAVALEFGKGRVIVVGEAAMLTAQVARRGFPFGMNVSGIDNRQLALNTMHWLSRILK